MEKKIEIEPILKYRDKTFSLVERKELYKTEVLDKLLNPIKDFNPETFDYASDNSDEYELAKRIREPVSTILSTMGMNPKKLLEGQMIGMYESKQDIYLTFANRCNQLQAEVELLKTEIELLKTKIK